MKTEQLLIIGALGIGAYLMFGKKAQAATYRPPAAAAQPSLNGQGQGGGLAGTIGAVTGLLGAFGSMFGGSGYNPANPIGASNDGRAGEAEARNYFLSNQDLFAVNPPTSYTSYTGNYGGIDAR